MDLVKVWSVRFKPGLLKTRIARHIAECNKPGLFGRKQVFIAMPVLVVEAVTDDKIRHVRGSHTPCDGATHAFGISMKSQRIIGHRAGISLGDTSTGDIDAFRAGFVRHGQRLMAGFHLIDEFLWGMAVSDFGYNRIDGYGVNMTPIKHGVLLFERSIA